MKEKANAIVLRINSGEPVIITATQITEIINIFENLGEYEKSVRLQRFFLTKNSIRIVPTTKNDILEAHEVVKKFKENKMSLNDAIAYVTMIKEGIKTIYSFDKCFDLFKDIERVTE